MLKFKLSAFTLVELLVVIAIVGLLSTIVLVITNGVIDQGRIATGLQFSKHLENALGDYLVGRWVFNEGNYDTCLDSKDACDSSGWNNNGTFYGNVSYVDDTPLDQGHALSFDGDGDYVDCGNNEAFYGVENMTISFWYNFPQVVVGHVLSKGSAGYEIYTHTNNNSFNSYFGSAYTGGDATVKLNQWTNLVYVKNGTNVKVYENGQITTNTTLGGEISYNNSNNLNIGKRSTVNLQYINGLIDEVSIYSTALTASQIRLQYYTDLDKLLVRGLISREEYQQKLNI